MSLLVDSSSLLLYNNGMKKNKFVIKLNRSASDMLKENDQQRKERLAGRRLTTQTVPNKKKRSRAQMKQKFNRGEY